MKGGCAQDCLLASLAHPRLGGALPGLALIEQRLEPRASHFSCCDGRGLRLSADGSVTYSCRIGERLRETRRLVQLYQALTGGDLGQTLGSELRPGASFPRALELLHLIAKSGAKRGLAWIDAAAESSPDPVSSALRPAARAKAPAPQLSVWTVAMAAAWRFGLRVHVVHLNGSLSSDLLPQGPAPDLICVGRAGGFWDPHTVEKLETLISYAYGALTPVFMQLQTEGKAPVAKRKAYGKIDQLVADRLAAARAKSPLAWLQPACVGKLLAVTVGLEALALEASGGADAKAPAGPGQPVPQRWRT